MDITKQGALSAFFYLSMGTLHRGWRVLCPGPPRSLPALPCRCRRCSRAASHNSCTSPCREAHKRFYFLVGFFCLFLIKTPQLTFASHAEEAHATWGNFRMEVHTGSSSREALRPRSKEVPYAAPCLTQTLRIKSYLFYICVLPILTAAITSNWQLKPAAEAWRAAAAVAGGAPALPSPLPFDLGAEGQSWVGVLGEPEVPAPLTS